MPLLSTKHRCFSVYECRQSIYLVALNKSTNIHDILEINRPLSFGDNDKLVSKIYSKDFSSLTLDDHMKLNKATLTHINVAIIYGVIRLLSSQYLILVTKTEKVANIHGNYVYQIKETEMVPLVYKLRNTVEETRYKNILTAYSLNNNDFYFSYSYNLTQSLQNNLLAEESHKSTQPLSQSENTTTSSPSRIGDQSVDLQERFVWNTHALEPLMNCPVHHEHKSSCESAADSTTHSEPPDISSFIVPVIHGYLSQHSVQLVTQQTVKYTLIARRSSLFAGTRYLRRGANR